MSIMSWYIVRSFLIESPDTYTLVLDLNLNEYPLIPAFVYRVNLYIYIYIYIS